MANLEDRTATTEQLVALSKYAEELGLDRYLSTEAQAALDPGGRHVLKAVVVNHTRPSAGLMPTHHRCQVYLKLEGLKVPASAWLDVTLSDWLALPTLADTLEVYKAKQRGALRRTRGTRQ